MPHATTFTAVNDRLHIRRACSCTGLWLLLVAPLPLHAERINHEGRILGPEPVVTSAILFNTAQADAVVSAMQIFPTDNPWNEDISSRPLLSNSDAMITQINSELASDRRDLRAFYEMNFVLVPDSQPLVPINFFNWPGESDPSPYPIPSNMPVETWPRETGSLTLSQWQEDINNTGGDRHSIIVQPGAGHTWETWLTKRVGTAWQASNGAKFNLKDNSLRHADWTSGDAAGLSMFGGLVRYDECMRGKVEHAVRLIVKHTRAQYIYPATHHASVPSTTDPNVPAMGQRLRLKAGVTIPGTWSTPSKAVAYALKKYGGLLADNGNFFSMSVTPDDRYADGAFDDLRSLTVSDFEVVQTTASNAGPRSAGAPTVNAGADRTVPLTETTLLHGTYTAPAGTPAALWSLYEGPGTAQFDNASKTNASVTFGAAGKYTLLLRVTDGIHTPAYDAVVLTVVAGIAMNISLSGANASVEWSGANPPYVLEKRTNLLSGSWQAVQSNSAQTASVPMNQKQAFFRARGQAQ